MITIHYEFTDMRKGFTITMLEDSNLPLDNFKVAVKDEVTKKLISRIGYDTYLDGVKAYKSMYTVLQHFTGDRK